jgi:ATP synthase protein I
VKSERPRLDMKTIREGTTVGAVGLEMGMSVVIGYTVGYYLDKWLGTHPLMAIIWIGFGLAAAGKSLYVAYLRAKNIGKDDEDESTSG